MKAIFILFIAFNSLNFAFQKKQNYNLVFEYLYSDEKDIFEMELFNRPKDSSLDFGNDIFYSGPIEKIENFAISKLVNFTKEDFIKNKNQENKKINPEAHKNQKEEKIKEYENEDEKIIDKKDINKDKNQDINDKSNNEYSENEYDKYDDIFFGEPLIRRIFNYDYDKFIQFIKKQYSKNKRNNNIQKEENPNYQRPNIQIIQPYHNNDFPIIRIIKYPNNNKFKTTLINNNNNYDPFDFYDEFNNFNNFFKSMESELNNIYRTRFLLEKNNENENKENSKQKIFSYRYHNVVYISNILYFDYIKYLPKSTIIITQKQFIKNLRNYQDYYIFTTNDPIAISRALTRSENTYYKIKIGQNFENSNLIIISLTITIFICIVVCAIYSYLLRHNEEEDILPVYNLLNKFPQYLCLLNILMYFVFITSYNESDGYFMIVKFVSMFLYSLFKSMFICILILLLNGWMTLSFVGWAQKLNKVIPIIFFEILTSISFEIIGFYNIVPFNKLQLYYFRDIFENIIIISLALISINRYYIPLNNKCKYLHLINSDFNDAYDLKKRKMISFSLFGIIYGIILIISDYMEFNLINKYLQNNTLHVLREIIFMSLFNTILMITLIPKELPYLFTEETDLLKTQYLLSDLNEKNILNINDKEIKNIKKELNKNGNVNIVLVNPFFDNKSQNDPFEELHLGNAIKEI